MIKRTVQFIGRARSFNDFINVKFEIDNKQVFNGKVTARPWPDENIEQPAHTDDILFSFPFDITVTGEKIPVRLAASGGDIFFTSLFSNYSGYSIVNNQVGVYPKDYFSGINQNTFGNDGKTDIMIDGNPVQRVIMSAHHATGDWSWLVKDGSVLTCNFSITRTIIDPPDRLPDFALTADIWTPDINYCKHKIINLNGKLYRSRREVPPGIDIKDSEYWLQTEVRFPETMDELVKPNVVYPEI